MRLGCVRRWGGARKEMAKKDCKGMLLLGVICTGKWIFRKGIEVRGPGERNGWRALLPIRKLTRDKLVLIQGLRSLWAISDIRLLVRMMMKLWVTNSVPHPPKNTSEPMQ